MNRQAWLCSLLAAALTCSLVFNGWQQKKLSEYESLLFHGDWHSIYVKKAVLLWRQKSGESDSDIKAGRFANVIELGKTICVQLNFSDFSLGGVPVYCFDRKTTRLIERYDDVE